MSLVEQAQERFDVQVSVISAGLGLLGLEDMIPAYAATLISNHDDSVLNTTDAQSLKPSVIRRRWWNTLVQTEVLNRDRARRLAYLDVSDPDTRVIICTGRNYIDAISLDLTWLMDGMQDRGRVMIFTSGKALPSFKESWVTISGSMRQLLGGSMSTVSTRTAAAVLQRTPDLLDATMAREKTSDLLGETEEVPLEVRSRRRDEDIRDWILDYLTDADSQSKSAALRAFRDDGNACEQARFGRIFVETQQLIESEIE